MVGGWENKGQVEGLGGWGGEGARQSLEYTFPKLGKTGEVEGGMVKEVT